MRRSAVFLFCLACVMLGITVGCKDKKPESSQSDSLAVDVPVDTVDTVVVDTVPEDAMDSLISATPMPQSADELFDDFLFNFTANKKLQYERVTFPLKVVDGDSESFIQYKEWRQEHFFMKQEMYTLIFDDESQLALLSDTTLDSVVVEKINLRAKSVEQHIFNRLDGKWKLTQIVRNTMFQNPNKSFLAFYEKFATDSVFQVESMAEPVSVTLPDPDDDFSMIEGDFYPEQWPEFKPGELPSEELYNIIYGQEYRQSRQKLFVLRGISNGFQTEMTFRQIDGKWKLVKLVN